MTDFPNASFLHALADAADAETLPRFRRRTAVDNKLIGAFDPVTEADRAAERAICRLIGAAYPAHAILGEEYGASGEGALRWVIDPIDGTRAFISGVPVWGTLIGFTAHGRARAGMMSQPFTGERFWADAGGAFHAGPHGSGALCVSSVRRLAEANAFTTSPRLFAGPLMPRFEALEAQTNLMRFGTDCYGFAMVAAGHADLAVESGLKPYDIVALIAIVEGAGGIVSTWSGGRAEEGGDVIAAATPELHAEALAILDA